MNKYVGKRYENVVYSCIIEAETKEEAFEILENLEDEKEFYHDQYLDFIQVEKYDEKDPLNKRYPLVKYDRDREVEDE